MVLPAWNWSWSRPRVNPTTQRSCARPGNCVAHVRRHRRSVTKSRSDCVQARGTHASLGQVLPRFVASLSQSADQSQRPKASTTVDCPPRATCQRRSLPPARHRVATRQSSTLPARTEVPDNKVCLPCAGPLWYCTSIRTVPSHISPDSSITRKTRHPACPKRNSIEGVCYAKRMRRRCRTAGIWDE